MTRLQPRNTPGGGNSVEFTVEVRRHSLPIGHAGGLSAYGRRLAAALSNVVDPYDLVLSSPELRALETAELLARGVVSSDKHLAPADADFGEVSAHAGFDRFATDQTEQAMAIGLGVLHVLDGLDTPTGRVLVVTHAGVVQAVAAVAGGQGLGAAPRWCEGVALRRTSRWECLGALRIDEEVLLEQASHTDNSSTNAAEVSGTRET